MLSVCVCAVLCPFAIWCTANPHPSRWQVDERHTVDLLQVYLFFLSYSGQVTSSSYFRNQLEHRRRRRRCCCCCCCHVSFLLVLLLLLLLVERLLKKRKKEKKRESAVLRTHLWWAPWRRARPGHGDVLYVTSLNIQRQWERGIYYLYTLLRIDLKGSHYNLIFIYLFSCKTP